MSSRNTAILSILSSKHETNGTCVAHHLVRLRDGQQQHDADQHVGEQHHLLDVQCDVTQRYHSVQPVLLVKVRIVWAREALYFNLEAAQGSRDRRPYCPRGRVVSAAPSVARSVSRLSD